MMGKTEIKSEMKRAKEMIRPFLSRSWTSYWEETLWPCLYLQCFIISYRKSLEVLAGFTLLFV